MPRQQEISKYLYLNPVQQDLYWRKKYKHDDYIEQKAKVHLKAYKSNSPIPTAPQLKSITRSMSHSQLSHSVRPSSYEDSTPTQSSHKTKDGFQKHALKQPKPLKITRKTSDQTAAQAQSSSFSNSYSRYSKSMKHTQSLPSLEMMNSEPPKRLSTRGTSLLEACQVNPFSASQRYSHVPRTAKTSSSGVSNIGTRSSSSWKRRQSNIKEFIY
eukprot:m.39180 g.39180  ORF g.39180 m.39180 type:complete len:213 (-) comp6845_c0_seq1:38-676(-)